MNANNLPLSVFLWPNVLTLKDHFLANVQLVTVEMALPIAQVRFDDYNYFIRQLQLLRKSIKLREEESDCT